MLLLPPFFLFPLDFLSLIRDNDCATARREIDLEERILEMNLVSGSVCLGGQTAYNPLLRTGFVPLLRGNGDRPDTTRVCAWLGCFSSEIEMQ